MNNNQKKTVALILLLAGMVLIFIGFRTNINFYSYAAIGCVVASMLLGGYWKPRRRR